jgi:hypothetical protein
MNGTDNLQQINDVLKEQGFSGIEKYLRGTKKSHVLIANKNKECFFIKISFNNQSSDNLVNEVLANNFIDKIKPKTLPLYIPKSCLVQKKNYTMAAFECIKGKSLADQDNLKIIWKPNQRDFEKLFQIAAFYIQIPKTKVPAYFVRKAKEYGLERCRQKINGYLDRPMGKLINQSEKEKLLKNLEESGYRPCFQHHDFVLWNMFKNKNDVVLTDAEFSRWGMKWYDIAYFFVQTYVYLQKPELAKKILEYFIKRFKEQFPKENIEKEIMFPLNYRITANLNEALGNKKLEKLARELLKKILTNKMEKVIA